MRRVVCGVWRQDLKAVQAVVAAWVASFGEAEQAWWEGVVDEEGVMAKVVVVWMGSLLIHRGMSESGVVDIVESRLVDMVGCIWWRMCW